MTAKRLLSGCMAMAAAAFSAFAGNVPQYSMTADAAPYEAITGTPIYCTWTAGGTTGLFPTGEFPAPYEAPGFEIGFDFKFGGRHFDQFMITTAGRIYLGEGIAPYTVEDIFCLGMSPIKGGVTYADISYATTGEPGKQVLTVQYANAKLYETSTECGMFNLQIRLYEENGQIEMAFSELRAPMTGGNGFDVSLHGWDMEDSFVITAPDIAEPAKVSKYNRAHMLDNESYVHWNVADGSDLKSVAYRFTPAPMTNAPKAAPTDLTVTQTEKHLDVTLKRGRDARATAVLWSTEPIDASDLPADGETFGAGDDVMLGNAHVLYYGPSKEMKLVINDVKDGTDYYVTALSANGYPAFNIDNMATVHFRTAQAPPHTLTANATGTSGITVQCGATCNVIVAVTHESVKKYQQGYIGTFGIPQLDAQVGDEIPGGGRVVYVGEPGTFDYECDPNSINFFRAWSVDGDRVSSNYIDACAIADVSLPYAPGIEDYPLGETIRKWKSGPTGREFGAYYREKAKDFAVYEVADMNYAPISLSTPLLPLDGPVNISFEFGMETQRDPEASEGSGGVVLPQGCEPGWFGKDGYFNIKVDGKTVKTITTYKGTMDMFDDKNYYDFSASWQPVSIDVAAVGHEAFITFEFATEKATRIFLRRIVVTPLAENPKAPEHAPSALHVEEDQDGIMDITCKRGADAEYTLVLFNETPMTETELPVDGRFYNIGDKIGNSTVLYFGQDENVACKTTYILNDEPVIIFPDYDTDYYIRAISGSANPLYNNTTMAEMTYHSKPDPNSVEGILDGTEGPLSIFTLTGIRLEAESLEALPAGLYIVNGQKVIVK